MITNKAKLDAVKTQMRIIEFIITNERMPSQKSNKLEKRLYDSLAHFLRSSRHCEFAEYLDTLKFNLKIPQIRKPELNKTLLVDFALTHKRKPSRYSKDKEERRLWSVMAGYTTKSSQIYDRVFTEEFNNLLESLGFNFKKPPGYWTISRAKKEAKKYTSYSEIVDKNGALGAAICRLGLKTKDLNLRVIHE